MDVDDYSCAICKNDCLVDCILCDGCSNWTHFDCMVITEDEKAHLNGSRDQESFYCTECCTENGQFNFERSLLRLSEASDDSIANIISVALIEAIMIKQFPMSNYVEENFDYTELNVDKDSCELLNTFRTSNYVALDSTVKNCLFNSLSILLYGNEKSSVAIRVKTCVYMALHKEAILENIPNDLLSVSSDFDESLITCSRNYSWPDSISIFAAASALSINIKMIYPPINGLTDSNIGILNEELTPLGKNPTRTVILMWTGGFTKGFNYEGDFWKPNHIVPVVLKSNINIQIKDEPEESSTIDNLTNENENENENEKTYLIVPREIPLLLGSTRNNRHFLASDEIIDIILNNRKPIVAEVPLGRKENCYFVVDNRKNVQRIRSNLTNRFRDDCGAWCESRGNASYYLKEGKAPSMQYKSILCKASQFYIMSKSKYILLEPQPKQNEILTIKKRHNKLKRDKRFQRRISYIDYGTVAVYEYIGCMPSI